MALKASTKSTKCGRDELLAGVLSEEVQRLDKFGWSSLTTAALRDLENNPIHGLCTDERREGCQRDGECRSYPVHNDRRRKSAFAECRKVRMVEYRMVIEL